MTHEADKEPEKVLPPWFDDIDEIVGDALRKGDEHHKSLKPRFDKGDGIREVIDDKHLDFDDEPTPKEADAPKQ